MRNCRNCGRPLDLKEKEICPECKDKGTWMLPDSTVDELQRRVGGLLKPHKDQGDDSGEKRH